MPHAKLDVAGLSKYFYARGHEIRKVLDNITVTVGEGEFVSIVGASGCGKTTCCASLHGLIHQRR